MGKFTIGVDVGGTNVKLGLVNAFGKIIARSHLDTKAFIRNKHYLINALAQSIINIYRDNSLAKKDVSGVGIGLPGLINPAKGVVDFLPNIPDWKNVPLQRLLESKTSLKIYLENDVNLITLGEWKFGAGRGYKNLLCITLGTGVGGGLILNDRLYRGEGFVAGEVGHMPLNEKGPACNCGGFGCFERYVGNKKLLADAIKIFKKPDLHLPDIYSLALQGDHRAVKFWNEVGTHIGNALVGVVNLLNPRLIIIGGGVAHNFRFFAPRIREVIRRRAMKVQAKMVNVVQSQLIDDAGIIGAQVLVKDGIIA